MGVRIPKTDVGLDLASGCYIQVRSGPAAFPATYGIISIIEPGGKTGTLAVGHAFTSWFHVDSKRHSWLLSGQALVGKTATLEVSGTLLVSGTVDVKFSILDEEGNAIHVITHIDARSVGLQLASTSIHGKLRYQSNSNSVR
jgi:hypothetical protein